MILIIGLGLVATYTGYVLGQFKLRYPHVHSMADAGEILLGRFGREFLGTAQLVFLIFIMGSHILTFTVMMNTVTNHGTCSIVFGIVGLILSFVCTLPRTLKKVSWLSISCKLGLPLGGRVIELTITAFISIIAAVLITMIAIGIQRPGDGHIDVTVDTSLYKGFLAVTNIVFAYGTLSRVDSDKAYTNNDIAGHVAFFGFISEMETPTDYPKTLYLLQATDTTMYTVTALVIYRYGGKDVSSPALGSTSPLVSKIAYGIAIPTV